MTNQNKLNLKLLTKVGILLHECGVSSHQLERNLSHLSDKIKCKSDILISPTSISISVEDSDNQISNNIRITSGGIDFSKLSDVRDVIKRIHNKESTIEQALEDLKSIEKAKPNHSLVINSLAFGVNAIGLCIFFQIPLSNMPITFLSGILAGAVYFSLSRLTRWSRISLTIAAFIPTLFLFLCSTYISGIEIQNSIFASLIVLIPGLSLTVSLTELASSHLISGTARLMGAIVEFFKISLGVLSAWNIANYFNISVPKVTKMSYHFGIKVTAIILCSLCLTILFNAKKKDFKWILLSSAISLGVLEVTQLLKNQNLAIFISAFFIGIFSNQFGRRFNRPVQILGLPAMILLVPGSIALKGINLAAANNLFGGVGQTVNALTLAIMIVAGLFLADTVTPEPN